MRKNSLYLDKIINEKNSICSMQIVFVDIVKYSRRKTKRQVEIINFFTKLIENAIDDTARMYINILSHNELILKRDIVILPTGDGVAIGLPFDWLNDIHLNLCINILNRIHASNLKDNCKIYPNQNWCDCHNSFEVRIGISEGKVILYKDINGNYNIAGYPINMAARVMNIGSNNQIIFTENAYNQFINLSEKHDINESFQEYNKIEIKHKIFINIYQYKDGTLNSLNSNKVIGLFNPKKNEDENVSKTQEIRNELNIVNTDELSIGLINIKPGKFIRIFDNSKFEIKHFFAISKFLITQEQFKSITGNNPSHFKGASLPVENITFFEAISFCNSLSIKDGFDEVYSIEKNNIIKYYQDKRGYRLPFEIEWDYILKYDIEEINNSIDLIAWYSNNSKNKTHKVGSKRSNSLSIFDLLGNVWEMCYDNFVPVPNYEKSDNLFVQIRDSKSRVIKGGSFVDFRTQFGKEGLRKKVVEGQKSKVNGFRVVLQNIKIKS